MNTSRHNDCMDGIAIISMVGRFPGSKSVEAFWQNLVDGKELISFLTDEELKAAGIAHGLISNPNYIKAQGVLEDTGTFDARFFDINPREAEVLDPQHRVFLECAWEALEKAGYDSESYQGSIGVFASASMNSYVFNIFLNPDVLHTSSIRQITLGNDKDGLPLRVSYKLNLKGPSLAIQTSCSSSLVAVHLACQSLLNYECDMALAGGATIGVPHPSGYIYTPGGLLSPDGHCRAFDSEAHGMVGGNGVGIVVLKRLTNAISDGDQIYAVIKGSAINNDGNTKAGYTAPSIDGQAEVITMAQSVAGVDPEDISYIEAHGTGTELGDPIEVAALTQAFRARTDSKGFCGIGSVKTNIGHLDATAGIAGLIKTALALHHKALPPTLHYKTPNPKIDIENSPFYVVDKLTEWKADSTPRLAGVSSFGIGGTNAHVVLQESPVIGDSGESKKKQLILLSAKSQTALDKATRNLVEHLRQNEDLNLADVAYTLQSGRRRFSHRRMVVSSTLEESVVALENHDPKRVLSDYQEATDRPVVFMFPGQGSQYVNMGLELYQQEPVFREQVDLCSQLLKSHLGFDLREILYPSDEYIEEARLKLDQTFITQPALFVIEYALAKLWMQWGIKPQAMIGHSIGEYVAACLAEVISLQEALELVTARGKLIQELPVGAMLSVSRPYEDVQPLLSSGLSLAASNGPSHCTISGPADAITALEVQLAEQGIEGRRLRTSHAFHSSMMDQIKEPFTRRVEKINMNPPKIRYISNVTGKWITTRDQRPDYWARHLRQPVRFAEGLRELADDSEVILLEVGPGHALATLAKQQLNRNVERIILPSMRSAHSKEPDLEFLLNTLGRLWLAGARVDWKGFYGPEQRRRVPLPTYPFERQRYWIEPRKRAQAAVAARPTMVKLPEIADWFYLPSWKKSIPSCLSPDEIRLDKRLNWLIFLDECGLGSRIAQRLEMMGQEVFTVTLGDSFAQVGEKQYAINPREKLDYDILLSRLRISGNVPEKIVHLWSLTHDNRITSEPDSFEDLQDKGLYSLLFLVQAFEKYNFIGSRHIWAISNNVQDVTSEEVLCPAKATLLAACKVIPQEYLNIACHYIDVLLPEAGGMQAQKLIDHLVAEFTLNTTDPVVAYRGKHRWVQIFEPMRLDGENRPGAQLRQEGVYLIVGGLGDIGAALAAFLAETVRAKLVLTGRTIIPDREAWEQYLKTHDSDDEISRKISRVQAIEDLGAEVLVISADVADEERMREVMRQASERFGEVNGVIYAAGVAKGNILRTIKDIDYSECDSHFRPKAHGIYVLERVLEGKNLDFCVLQSSLASVLGGLGFFAYAAANLFMDAFVCRHNLTSDVPWVSVNWEGWKFTRRSDSNEGGVADLAMMAEEGVEAFRRIISIPRAGQIVVSSGDLQTRINQWIALKPLTNPPGDIEKIMSYSRPGLQSQYVAPSNETEEIIVDFWQSLLGIKPIGIHDNFFELGGDSLLAMQVITRIRETLAVEIALPIIFELPTVAELAVAILQGQAEDSDDETLDQILLELEQL